jgi:hypothetical protein
MTLVILATILGGPLAGSYTFAENYRLLGKRRQAVVTLIAGTLCSMLLFSTTQFIPLTMLEQMPPTLLPILYSSCIFGLLKLFQERLLDEAFQQGAKRYSVMRTIAVSLLALLASVLLYIPIAVMTTLVL